MKMFLKLFIVGETFEERRNVDVLHVSETEDRLSVPEFDLGARKSPVLFKEFEDSENTLLLQNSFKKDVL